MGSLLLAALRHREIGSAAAELAGGDVAVEVVQEEYALAALFQLLKSREVDVGRENRDVTLRKIFEELRRMLQVREAEERSDQRATRSHLYGAVAHLDFLLGQLYILRIRISRQILVRPGVGADRSPGFDYLLGDFGVPHCVYADLKECGLQTFVGQRLEGCGRVLWPGAVVERQKISLSRRKSYCLKCWKTKPGPPVVSISTIRER